MSLYCPGPSLRSSFYYFLFNLIAMLKDFLFFIGFLLGFIDLIVRFPFRMNLQPSSFDFILYFTVLFFLFYILSVLNITNSTFRFIYILHV